ncbi:adenylate cyclase, terminal-differentiation specific isoform X2 [Frankliniella occidentalis]|uniref:Adenylate cyclase, terminal-differentiation specific isoform X2 n=1 Tax=Frankliniella occidentalis TaxID=133901 RepID=A0A6J1SXI7_FRAOC|nr:adenylate cyclase, terminal-differentiation specific isoform X2 [Frankliniella occidentalis]
MDASTPPKMMLLFALALWGCVSGQNFPGASQYWGGQPQAQQQPQQQQQPLQFQQPFQSQQPQQQQPSQQPNGLNGYRQQQDQLPGLGFQQQQQQQPHQADPLSGLRQGSPLQQHQQSQLPGFRQPQGAAAFGRPTFPQDDKENASAATTRTPFQSRLFGQQGAGAGPGAGASGAPGEQGEVPPGQGEHGPHQQDGGLQQQDGGLYQRGLQQQDGVLYQRGLHQQDGGLHQRGLQKTDGGVLELEPHGVAKQPQPDRPDSQIFHSTASDHSLYALDWSYPRARHAPASLMLKRWGGLSPPEYVAVYRLRGPATADQAAASSPSYSLAHDELRHYPWDAARRHGPPRWRGAPPRDEDFELLPAGMSMGSNHGLGNYGLGLHGGNHQYMYRTL